MARTPNNYQARIIGQANDSLKAGRNVLIEAPTGAGKSGIASTLADDWHKATGERALILEDSLAIFRQMAGISPTGAAVQGEVEQWIGYRPGSIGDAQHGGDVQGNAPVVVGMVDTIQGWIENGRADRLGQYSLVLIDEAHHTYNHPDSQYRQVLSHLEEKLGKKLLVVGASATPWRPEAAIENSGYDQLDPAFLPNGVRKVDHLRIHFSEVHAEGRVVMPTTEILDRVSNERAESAREIYREISAEIRDHDAVMEEISRRLHKMRTPTWWSRAVRASVEIAGGDSTVWFVDNVHEDARLLTAAMDAEGVRYAEVNDKTGNRAKEQHLADFKAGRLKNLVSCGMLIEGFDAPIAKVAVIANRCTTKRNQQQMTGRVVRACAGYDGAKVVDLGATSWLHGKIEDRYAHEGAFLVSSKMLAPTLFNRMSDVGGGWRLHSNGALNWYARKVGKTYEVIEAAPRARGGKIDSALGKPQSLSEKDFCARLTGAMEDPRFVLGSASAPASRQGEARGHKSAWDEHRADRSYSGEELNSFFSPAKAAPSAKKAPARPARGALVIGGGLGGLMSQLQARVEVLGSAVAAAQPKTVLQSGEDFLSAFATIGEYFQRGKFKSARVELQIVQTSLQTAPMSFIALQAGLVAASKCLEGDEVSGLARQEACGAARSRVKTRLDELMSYVHQQSVAAQRTARAAAPASAVPAPRAA